jgi:hypothetical protein
MMINRIPILRIGAKWLMMIEIPMNPPGAI